MQILSKVLTYNNAAKPEYKYRVFFTDGLKKSYKVFKLKSLAVEFIKSAKEWNKGTSTPVLDVTDNNNTPNNIAPLPIAKSAVSKYQSIERICKEYNTTIEEILSFYVKKQEIRRKSIRFTAAVNQYISYVMNSDFCKKQKDRCYYFLTKMINAFANKYGKDILTIDVKPEVIGEWLNSLKKMIVVKGGKLIESKVSISDTTFNDYHITLQTFFNWCIKQGYTDKNPMDKIEKKKAKNEDVKYYDYEQCKEWLEKSEADTRLYIALALFTGIRKAELLRLKYENIYLEDKEIVLSATITKTRQRRIVKIPDNLVKYLEEANVSNKKGLVFKGENAIKCRIKRLAKKLSFKTIQNGFRHSAATYYLAKTQNEYETARQLGHSVEILKRHYAGLARNSEAEAFYKL